MGFSISPENSGLTRSVMPEDQIMDPLNCLPGYIFHLLLEDMKMGDPFLENSEPWDLPREISKYLRI